MKKNSIKSTVNGLRYAVACCLLLAVALGSRGQTYTRVYSAKDMRKAAKWAQKGDWRFFDRTSLTGLFAKAMPAETVNLVDFMKQYKANTEEWKCVFKWLQETNLREIPAGDYPIPGTELKAMVQVDVNHFSLDDLLAGQGSESHRKKIDLMYVVDGIEGFAALDHESSSIKTPYSEQKDRADYKFDARKLKLYSSVPGTFNLMFPDDWHIAKVKTLLDDQNIKVVVVKINYVER